MQFWQRPDITTRTGVLQPLVTHDFAREAALVASEWGPITVGTANPKELARAAEEIAQVWTDGFGAAVETSQGTITMLYDGPPSGCPGVCEQLWRAARRCADGHGALLVNDLGRRGYARSRGGPRI